MLVSFKANAQVPQNQNQQKKKFLSSNAQNVLQETNLSYQAAKVAEDAYNKDYSMMFKDAVKLQLMGSPIVSTVYTLNQAKKANLSDAERSKVLTTNLLSLNV